MTAIVAPASTTASTSQRLGAAVVRACSFTSTASPVSAGLSRRRQRWYRRYPARFPKWHPAKYTECGTGNRVRPGRHVEVPAAGAHILVPTRIRRVDSTVLAPIASRIFGLATNPSPLFEELP